MASTTVTLEQLTALNDEIASLIRSGVPLELGLRELSGDSTGALQDISRSLSERMIAGASLLEALHAEEQRLPAAYRTVVEAGLRSGRLSAALEALSNYARELVDLRRRITLAMTYPLIVTVLAYILFAVFMVDLLERVRETYEMLQLAPRWWLEIAFACGETVSRWWWAPPAVLAVALAWWAGTGGAFLLSFRGLARPLAWVPGVGRVSRYFRLAGFSDLVGLMVEHQVPLPEALRLSGRALCNARLERSTDELAAAIERGNGPVPDRRQLGFPPFLFWVLTSRDQAAGLARLLAHAGNVYRRRALDLAAWFKLIFPLMAVVVVGGGVTLFYAVTMFGALLGLWNDLGLD